MIEVPLWQSRFVVPGAAVELFLAELEDTGISVAAFEEARDGGADGALWRIELMHRGEPDQQELAARLAPLAERSGLDRIDLTIAPLAATDWLARVAESFTPRRIGRFWVHGSHLRAAPPTGTVAIELDAGLAFGSGEHESTRGCLLALDDLARRRRFRRVLDVGCGSGILAIAAARCWPAAVLAVDNDQGAVAVAAANARRNDAERVRTAHSDGYRSREVRAGAPYDLILANILADPLCDMARDLARHLAPGGTAILAGLFDKQAPRVIGVHRAAGLRLRARLDLGIWTTLVVTKRRRTPDAATRGPGPPAPGRLRPHDPAADRGSEECGAGGAAASVATRRSGAWR
jgi:ribosomal protein L11 methyltransferase